jgi:hypothetical protein
VIADQVACALATAAVSIAAATEDSTLPQAVFQTYSILKRQIEDCEGERLVL